MMRFLFSLSILSFNVFNPLWANSPDEQAYVLVNPENVSIARDIWGVPHIFGGTDAEVAYGLAWANAEDAFHVMQELLLPAKGMAGKVFGADGAKQDFLFHSLGVKAFVAEHFHKDISAKFQGYLDAYCQGLNAYALKYPKQVLYKKAFPVVPTDLAQMNVLVSNLLSKTHTEIQQIIGGEFDLPTDHLGSNAFAISSSKSKDGLTHLVINPHQPNEGPLSWYEAHLHSDEGLNMTGALFPGGQVIFLGNNEHLGWAFTFNGLDLVDSYKLKMHPKELQYELDGEWHDLEVSKVTLKVKLLGKMSLPIKKKIYFSKIGPVYRSKKGKQYFALRTPAMMDLRSMEQMHLMAHSTNYDEWMDAVRMQSMPRFNTVYADKDDNIYYLCNGRIPVRADGYDWSQAVPGSESVLIWHDLHPVDSLPQVLNPKAGYVFNTNNSPFNATAETENVDRNNLKRFPLNMNFHQGENNRSLRFMELMAEHQKLDLDDIKRLKYDEELPACSRFLESLDPIFYMDRSKSEHINALVPRLQAWDKVADSSSIGATIFSLVVYRLFDQLDLGAPNFMHGIPATIADLEEAMNYAGKYLIKKYGSYDVPLHQFQRLMRGEVNLYSPGFMDVLGACYLKPDKKGVYHNFIGDSFTQFATFSKEGAVNIESLHPYGASHIEDSKHYTSQMQRYRDQEPKVMSLDKAEILKAAVRVYHPR